MNQPKLVLGWTLAGLVFSACGGDTTTGPASVASVLVSPSQNTLRVFETVQLGASTRDASGAALSGRAVTWSSSNDAVATVSGSGLVTGVSEGTVTITATSEGVNGTAQVVVNPAAVASVEVSPSSDTVKVAESVQLSATLRDQQGGELAGRTVTWSSGDPAIAAVDGTGLVTGVAVGSVTITAEVEGQSGTAEIEVIPADFEPTEDVEISGEVNFSQVDIPEGVTVTVTGDLVLNASDSVTIAGSLVGDCVTVTINGGSSVTVAGTISNVCTVLPPAGTAPSPLTIVSDGDLIFEGALVESSGDGTIVNDPALLPAAFSPSASPRRAGPSPSQERFLELDGTFVHRPGQAASGSSGQKGENGSVGARWDFRAKESMVVRAGVEVVAQHGGDGGDGTDIGPRDVSATGGDGRAGGIIFLLAEFVNFDRSVSTFRTGRGGIGGRATATALINPASGQAPSATARSGQGGGGGDFSLKRTNVSKVFSGLVIVLGRGGGSFPATATGAPGVNATDQRPAQIGGDAEAHGGGVIGNGNVRLTGIEELPLGADIEFSPAPPGGDATATAGVGGDGICVPFPDGAKGGDIYARGRSGGDASSSSAARSIDNEGGWLGDGGAGGRAEHFAGNGGDGADCPCLNEVFQAQGGIAVKSDPAMSDRFIYNAETGTLSIILTVEVAPVLRQTRGRRRQRGKHERLRTFPSGGWSWRTRTYERDVGRVVPLRRGQWRRRGRRHPSGCARPARY